jgi:hypothetical protein
MHDCIMAHPEHFESNDDEDSDEEGSDDESKDEPEEKNKVRTHFDPCHNIYTNSLRALPIFAGGEEWEIRQGDKAGYCIGVCFCRAVPDHLFLITCRSRHIIFDHTFTLLHFSLHTNDSRGPVFILAKSIIPPVVSCAPTYH